MYAESCDAVHEEVEDEHACVGVGAFPGLGAAFHVSQHARNGRTLSDDCFFMFAVLAVQKKQEELAALISSLLSGSDDNPPPDDPGTWFQEYEALLRLGSNTSKAVMANQTRVTDPANRTTVIPEWALKNRWEPGQGLATVVFVSFLGDGVHWSVSERSFADNGKSMHVGNSPSLP